MHCFTALKHGFKLKVLLKETTWFLFEVNQLFHSKDMIIVLAINFVKLLSQW